MASPTRIKALDKAFSLYIRTRDTLPQYPEPVFICCSCGQLKPYEMADAGHFINRRWMSVRWDERNVHAQCSSCNRFDEGNAIGYARFMDKKYGTAVVDMLFALKTQTAKWADWELKELEKMYKLKTKELLTKRSTSVTM